MWQDVLVVLLVLVLCALAAWLLSATAPHWVDDMTPTPTTTTTTP